MVNIRCDKSMEDMVGSLIESLHLDGKVAQNDECDICILFQADLKMINNLGSNSILIANADDFSLLRTLEGMENTIITCGLSGISTVTASSIEEDTCVLCLQRETMTISGRRLLPMEIPVHITGKAPDINQTILLLTLGLICDADYEDIQKIKLC